MIIFVVGGNGLLGKRLIESSPKSYRVITSYYNHPVGFPDAVKLDIADPYSTKSIISKVNPTIIINAASLGDVDYCEAHQKEAWKVNVIGTQNLLSIAKEINAKFIFFSTNAVFDGKNPPYDETSATNPVNFYGKTKVAAEKLVWQYKSDAIILRLMTMYGWNEPNERTNPATWILSCLKQNKKTPVVDDVFNNHLWVGQAAQATWKAVEKKYFGEIFHIAGKDCVSRYTFCQKVAETFGFEKKLIIPVSSDYFSNIAKRPKNSCSATKKMTSFLGIKPMSIGAGLRQMKKEMNLLTS